jgi:hypothetical protein
VTKLSWDSGRARDRSQVQSARVAWLAIALSTAAIILALVYALGDFVLTTVRRVFAV